MARPRSPTNTRHCKQYFLLVQHEMLPPVSRSLLTCSIPTLEFGLCYATCWTGCTKCKECKLESKATASNVSAVFVWFLKPGIQSPAILQYSVRSIKLRNFEAYVHPGSTWNCSNLLWYITSKLTNLTGRVHLKQISASKPSQHQSSIHVSSRICSRLNWVKIFPRKNENSLELTNSFLPSCDTGKYTEK